MMKRIVAALAGLFALALPSVAVAQCSGLFTAGYFCGNAAATGGLAGANSPTAMFDRAFGATNNSTVVRLGGVWTVLSSANSGVWITSAAGVPSISSTLPNAVQDNITRLGTIASITTPLGATFGGTAQSSFAQGDILYASAINTLAKLAAASTGNALISGTTPSWGKIGISTHVSGLGTGIATALGVNVGTAGAPVVNGGALGTPSSATLTSATGLPIDAGTINTLPLTRGGTGQTTAPLARASSGLNIDAVTTHGDSIYTILSTDRVVATSAAFTASRTWTLPAANSVNAGQLLVVADLAGGVTGTNTLVISRAGADTINGGTSVTINAANNAFYLISDGSSKWTAQAQSAVPGTGTVTSATIAGTAGNIAVSGTCTITTTGTCTADLAAARKTLPTIQSCASGLTCDGASHTYTTPANVLWIEVRLVGAGGGGAGSTATTCGASGGNGSTASVFGSSVLTANVGAGGACGGAGGSGGSATIAGGALGRAYAGATGFTYVRNQSSTFVSGSPGANSCLGGGGVGGTAGLAGSAGVANTGAGGGGAGSTGGSEQGASGGGAGGCVMAIINSPSATYSYTVGNGGAGGTGTNAGGAGAAGDITVTEHYNYLLKRDLAPAANDNSPAFMNLAA